MGPCFLESSGLGLGIEAESWLNLEGPKKVQLLSISNFLMEGTLLFSLMDVTV